MRIGFDAKRAFFNRSGLGNYSRFIIQSLIKYHKDISCYLYTPKIKNAIDFLPESDRIQVAEPKQFLHRKASSYWRSIAMSNDMVKDDIEIFHGLSGEIPKNIIKTNIKTVVTIHDLIFLRYPELYKSIDRKIYEKKYRHACLKADKVIAISDQTKQDIVQYFGIDMNKIEVIYQGCDERFHKEATSELKEKVINTYNLPENYLLYVGTIEKRKNLLSIVKAIHQEKIETPLVVVGKKTPYYQTVADYIRENLVENIIFLSGVPNEHLPAIYQMAQMFIYPSVFEGFGIPILEALYSKTPVITSTKSCFPEAGGPSSIYVQPESVEEISDNIKMVLNDSSLRNKMIVDGYQHAQFFEHTKLTSQLVNLYKCLNNE